MTLAALAVAAALGGAKPAAIDALVKKTMSDAHIAGVTVVVSVNGATAYQKAFGLADIAGGKPAKIDTVYPIGSITKQFTAACVLLLAERGKLSLEDPLSRYVPALPWADRVTLRHLLDQESGIVDFRAGAIDYTLPLARQTVVDRLKMTDLLFPPGSRYEYTNSNYFLLGMVIEKVTGETYQDFLQHEVLTPLHLTSTFYAMPDAAASRYARPYVSGSDAPQAAMAENADWSFAAGALAATAGDLTRWDDALRSGAVLSKPSTHAMFTPGVLDDGAATDYAFGWVVVKHDGHREVWHNGEVNGFHAMNATYPDDATDVVVLTNTGQTFAADQLAVDIFDVLHPFVPSPADDAITARAKEWLGRIERGDVDRTQLTSGLSDTLTDAVVRSLGAQLTQFGALRSIDVVSKDEDASGRSYGLRMMLGKQVVRCVMGIDATGKISALGFHL